MKQSETPSTVITNHNIFALCQCFVSEFFPTLVQKTRITESQKKMQDPIQDYVVALLDKTCGSPLPPNETMISLSVRLRLLNLIDELDPANKCTHCTLVPDFIVMPSLLVIYVGHALTGPPPAFCRRLSNDFCYEVTLSEIRTHDEIEFVKRYTKRAIHVFIYRTHTRLLYIHPAKVYNLDGETYEMITDHNINIQDRASDPSRLFHLLNENYECKC